MFVFVGLVVCASVVVTEENFESVVKGSGDQVLLMELWDPYCDHCKAFRPTWDELAADTRYEGSVIFADVNCYENKKFCEKFETHGYPAVVFVENETASLSYTGALNLDALDAFIQKQLSFPVRIIEREWEISKWKENTNVGSVFFLVFYSLADAEFAIFKDVAKTMRNESCTFIGMMSSTQDTKLSVFKSPDVEVAYTGQWMYPLVSQFVKNNKRSLLPPLTSDIFEEFQKTGQKMLVAFLSHDQYKDVQRNVTTLTCPYPMFYQLWSADDYLCRYVGASGAHLPVYMLLDSRRSLWSKAPSHDVAALQTWIKGPEFKWSGPGDGPLSSILEPFYSVWALGGVPMYIMFSCVLATIVILVVFGVWCYRTYQEEQAVKRE